MPPVNWPQLPPRGGGGSDGVGWLSEGGGEAAGWGESPAGAGGGGGACDGGGDRRSMSRGP